MSDSPNVPLARLDDDQLEGLERRLTLAAARVGPGVHRGPAQGAAHGRGIAAEPPSAPPAEDDLEATQADILKTAREGVKIAPQAESHPLIPLYKAAKLTLPPEIVVDHEKLGYDFYLVEVRFSIFLPTDQWPRSAAFGLSITDDAADPARRTRAVRLFPDHTDVQYFQADLEGAVGVDAGMNLTIPLQGSALIPFAKAAANASLKTNLVFGPLKFQFRKAGIDVRGVSDQEIFWRYNLHSELTGTNDFKSVLVLKVAKETTQVTLGADLAVTPCKRRWLVFQEVLPELPAPPETLTVELARG